MFRALWNKEVEGAPAWFGMLGGAFLWLLHLVGEYAVSEWGCDSRLQQVRFLGANGNEWLLTAATLLLALLAALASRGAGRVEARLRRQIPDAREFRRAGGDIARAGRILSLLFALLILLQSVPLYLYLNRC